MLHLNDSPPAALSRDCVSNKSDGPCKHWKSPLTGYLFPCYHSEPALLMRSLVTMFAFAVLLLRQSAETGSLSKSQKINHS